MSKQPSAQKPMIDLAPLRSARPRGEEGTSRRRQLRRPLSAQRRRDARDVARRRGGNQRRLSRTAGPDRGSRDAMLGFLIQRLLQAFVVMMVISFLVFLGVYAIGNPIDVLISPDADQRIREMAIQQYGLDLPLWQQYLGFLNRLRARRFRPLLRLQHAGAGPDPVAPAGNARTDARRRARRDAARRAARHVRGLPARGPPRKLHHGAFDPRLLGADLLGRPRADPHFRGLARLAAGRRARRHGRRCSASSGASSRSTA